MMLDEIYEKIKCKVCGQVATVQIEIEVIQTYEWKVGDAGHDDKYVLSEKRKVKHTELACPRCGKPRGVHVGAVVMLKEAVDWVRWQHDAKPKVNEK